MKKVCMALLALLFFPAQNSWSQNDGYKSDYQNDSVRVKPAKWHDLKDEFQIGGEDGFDSREYWNLSNGRGRVQATHTNVDTLYVHSGETINLHLQDRLYSGSSKEYSVRTYQRWYDFRRLASFETAQGTKDWNYKDLLIPTGRTGYRFQNGYVGSPLTGTGNNQVLDNMLFHYPTADEFAQMFPGNTDSELDNIYYLIACDVSGYNDYTPQYEKETSKNSSFQKNGFWEPTLSHRFIYYISEVDGNVHTSYVRRWKEGIDNGRLTSSDERSNAYLEESEISFPAVRRATYTKELVSLQKEARGYAIPNVKNDNMNVALNVEVVDNSAGISLLKSTISGENTVIQFNYPSGDKVEDGSKASIIVYKQIDGKRYNIARYKLSFQTEGQLLSQSELEENQEEGKEFYFRSPAYLKDNYELLTELNFDYDTRVASELYNNQKYYPFPQNWDVCSYAFYDGSYQHGDFRGGKGDYAEWGYYALTNNYVECPGGGWGKNYPVPNDDHLIRFNSRGNKSSYHMYIDASDSPGLIARIPFKEKLCRGSELFVTAWVKSARSQWGSTADHNAAMMFTIMGVRELRNGEQAFMPIYRHQTGQIPTSFLDLGKKDRNDWMQVYFSFINPSDNIDFDSYIIQVDNQCASTAGGDMYLDDIRVYVKRPQAKVMQLSVNCVDDAVRVNFSMDWNRLLSRLGIDGAAEGNHSVDFCFVDTVKFANRMLELEPTIPDKETRIVRALEDAAVEPETGVFKSFQRFNFKTPFDRNVAYKAGDDNYSLARNNTEGEGEEKQFFFFAGKDDAGNDVLTADFFSMLAPNRPYWLLITDSYADEGETEAKNFLNDWGTNCAIKTEFMVQSRDLVRVNGEIIKPTTSYCAGKVLDFTVDLRVPVGDDYKEVTKGVYFDWFFGSPGNKDTEEEFLQANADYDNISVLEALRVFREYYPDADRITEDTPPTDGDGTVGAFTRNMWLLLKKYNDIEGTNDHYPGLALNYSKADLMLRKSGLHMIIMPIRTTLPPGSGITQEQWNLVCWNYIPILMNISGESPHMRIGFNDMDYPEEYNPNIRIGYKQLHDTDASKPLMISLREAAFVYDRNGTMQPIEPISPVADYEKFKYIYLVGTDDPEYEELFNDGANHDFDYPIGFLDDLHAEYYNPGSQFNDYMKVHFDFEGELVKGETNPLKQFRPKEGHKYVFTVYFEEVDKDGNSTRAACEGQFNVSMIVVPEYLVWNGTTKGTGGYTVGDWNNDDNWKRATHEQVGMAVSSDGALYPNSEGKSYENTGRAYTPMSFSKVIIPRKTQVELYRAGHTQRIWWENFKPDYIAPHTFRIEYDLMTFEEPDKGVYNTERYRANQCNQIHIEPEAEVVHAEYLSYNKAWVDYELEAGSWNLLSTPLQGVFAGDFYTKDGGTETGEYFQPISYDAKSNSRYQPSVYQRAWSQASDMQIASGSGLQPTTMAVIGNWSSVYNDVNVLWKPSFGFSMKIQDVNNTSRKALIRLPKADANYTYYKKDGSVVGTSPDLDRGDKAGRLISDQLYGLHGEFSPEVENEPITFTLENNNGTAYYLVGNPFTAHLDMKKFFEKNPQLQRKYWYVDGDKQGAAVGSGDGWVASGEGLSSLLIPPLRSFFVQLADETNKDLIFTSDMQVLGIEDSQTDASSRSLRITASAGSKESEAVIRYAAGAASDYHPDEDAELFLDSNLEGVPAVYTVAETKAVSVNQTDDMYDIPIGTYGATTEEVTLTFGGTESFAKVSLYDVLTHTETLLSEGSNVQVKGNVAGRYFLRAGAPVHNETIGTGYPLVYAVGKDRIVVASPPVPVVRIRIFRMDGTSVDEIKANDSYREIQLPPGVYVVAAETADGKSKVRKVRLY